MKSYAETTIRVRYAETDQMGVVYYGNYFTWFEGGRVELCRQLGFEYKQMELEDDSFIVVAEAQCRYKRPARFDDLLTIRTRVIETGRRTIRFRYEIPTYRTRFKFRASLPPHPDGMPPAPQNHKIGK